MKKRFLSFFVLIGEKLKKQNWTKISLVFVLLFSLRHVNREYWQKETDWMEAVGGDGCGYYAYLPATFIYQDYQFTFLDTIEKHYRSQIFVSGCGFCNTVDGKKVNKYFCGQSVAISPFFLIADTITRATGYPRDGYSYIYMIFVSLAAIAYALLGLICIARLLARLGIHDHVRAIVITGIYLGTNLFHYTVWSSSYSHVYSFAFIALFVLQIHRLCEKYSTRNLLLAAFALGMIIIIRPVNAIVVLSIPFIAGNGSALKEFFTGIIRRPFMLIAAGIIFSGIIFIQLGLYKIQSGHWYVYAYGKEGFDFTNPHLFQALFSYNAGMLVYSPVLFLSIAGLAFLFYRQLFRAISFVLFIVPVIWVISSWWAWNYAGSYGMRPLVEYYSVFAILLAFFLSNLNKKTFSLTALLLVLPLVILVQIQTWQFRVGMISWDGMTKEKYWRVFMQTANQYQYISTDNGPRPVPENAKLIFTQTIDFEQPVDSMDWRSVKKTLAVSGTHAVYFGEDHFHPPIWKHRLSEYIPDSIIARGNLMFEIRVKCRLENDGTNAKLIYNFQDESGIYYFADSYIIHGIQKEDEWTDFHWTFRPIKELRASHVFETYITKGDGEIMYFDDFTVNVWQW